LILGAIAPLSVAAAEVPESEAGAIPIPVEPAPEPAATPTRAQIPEPLQESLRVILTEGIEHVLRGESADLSPAMADQIAITIAEQVEQAARTDGAPAGLERLADALRILVASDAENAETEAINAIKDAITGILDTIP
jgi:hypothetical protein